jgi:hypothetical protein
MFYVDFENPNDIGKLRLKYKDDPIVNAMLDKIEELTRAK